MKIDYARHARELVEEILIAHTTEVDSSEIGLGIGYLSSSVEAQECVVLVEVEGAQTARRFFRAIATQLGNPGELVSQPERGNIWLECQCHYRSLLQPQAMSAQHPGSRWVCHLTSLPEYTLPEIQHYRVKDALEMRYCAFPDEHPDDQELVEVRQLVVEVAELLSGYKELADELSLSGYSHFHANGGGLTAVGLSSISSLTSLKPFIAEVLSEVSRFNTVGVFDIQQNPRQADKGWDGDYVVLLGRSMYGRHP